ncbi:MAG: carbohydrate binding domain-containing protein [Pirellulales bacterium]
MQPRHRAGAVYIAVLGTSLIVALLGMTALMAQRIQNRILTASTDIRQAHLNANTAVELALLTMKQDANWRTTQTNGQWFTGRGTAAGTCSLDVTDPVDANLANSLDDPVLVRGTGYSGQAEQRVEVTIDPRKEPLGCLRSAIASGDVVDLNADTLRTNGLITANQITATSSQVFGNVEAASVSGSTYNGTTTQIDAAKLPTMPDWATLFDYYRTNATQLTLLSLPTNTPNLGRNAGIENGDNYWTGTPPGLPGITASVSQSNNWVRSGSYSLRVQNRTHWSAGAVQRIDHFVKPGQQYNVRVWVHAPSLLGTRSLHMRLYTKGTGDAGPSSNASSSASMTCILVVCSPAAEIVSQVTAPAWTGELEYAYIKISDDASSLLTDDFYVDDLSITEVTSGRLIYRGVLGPGVNTLYAGAPTNAQGLYWIDCAGNRLTIEASRIYGTLLVVNPGANSGVGSGPICWTPSLPGYPALLVTADNPANANFAINASNRALNEADNAVNFNPPGVPYEFNSSLSVATPTDSVANDIYPSEIRGLVVIRNDLRYQNNPLVRGQVMVGGDIANSSGELTVDFQPESLLNPPPGFWAPYSYPRRPASARKVVLP